MRVVLDTNILTRVASSPFGPAGETYERLRERHLSVTSIPVLTELKRVLAYSRLRRLHQLSDQGIIEFVSRFATDSLVVSLPDVLARIVPDDPDDDSIVATAIAGKVDFLCTRNRHLFHSAVLDYCSDRGIAIIDDLALLNLLRSDQGPPAVRD